MESEFWRSVDKETINFKEHYSAFLDILGYKQKAELFFCQKLNIYKRINRAFETIDSANIFSNLFTGDYGLSKIIFSDSIIVYVPKKPEFLPMFLNYINSIAANLSFEGLLLRGGVSEGKYYQAAHPNEKDIFFCSEAHINACELEKNAKFPMTVIDDRVLRQAVCNKRSIRNDIIKYEDKHILNPLPLIVNKDAENIDDVIKEIASFIQYKHSTNDIKIRKKYAWLIDYYMWFLEKSFRETGNKKFLKYKQLRKKSNSYFKKFSIP